MSDGHRSGRSTGRVSCKSTELKRCSMTEMRYCYYYYYKRMPWSQKTSRALINRKRKTNDSVTQVKNKSQDCQRSNERLKSSVLSRRLKAINNGDEHRQYLLLQPFNGLCSRTTWVSRYQKGKSNLDFTGARDSEWQPARSQCCQVLSHKIAKDVLKTSQK